MEQLSSRWYLCFLDPLSTKIAVIFHQTPKNISEVVSKEKKRSKNQFSLFCDRNMHFGEKISWSKEMLLKISHCLVFLNFLLIWQCCEKKRVPWNYEYLKISLNIIFIYDEIVVSFFWGKLNCCITIKVSVLEKLQIQWSKHDMSQKPTNKILSQKLKITKR